MHRTHASYSLAQKLIYSLIFNGRLGALFDNLDCHRNLNNNKIKGNQTFQGNVKKKLQNLSLDGNDFEDVPRKLLVGMSNLKAL